MTTLTHEMPPPSDVERERLVLGAVLQNPALRADCGNLRAGDFHFQHHQWIWEAVRESTSADLVALSDLIAAKAGKDQWNDAGGYLYLVKLTFDVPYVLDLDPHIRRLKDMAARRGLMFLMADAGNGIVNNPDIQAVLTGVEAGLSAIQDGRMTAYDTTQSAYDIALGLLDDVLEWQSNPQDVRGYRTGLTELDEKLGGIQKRLLYYVCGRPGMGKSALLADIMRRHALDGGRVLLFALEMTAKAMMFRMACQTAKVDGRKARKGQLSREEDARLKDAIDRLAKAGILIEDQPGLSIREMQAIARRHERRQPLTMVMVDTMNLVASPGEKEYERMTLASRAAKDWAHGADYALICAVQLSRTNQQFTDKSPTLNALRGSGALEEDADVVLGVHRQGAYDWENPELEHQAEVLIMKNREGDAFKKIKLYWDATWPGFENAAISHHDLSEQFVSGRHDVADRVLAEIG